MDLVEKSIVTRIPRSELERYFKTVCEDSGNGTYVGENFAITLSESKAVKLGAITLFETRISFKGPEETIAKVMEEYRRSNLKGGG
jgi:hypothetical protein